MLINEDLSRLAMKGYLLVVMPLILYGLLDCWCGVLSVQRRRHGVFDFGSRLASRVLSLLA